MQQEFDCFRQWSAFQNGPPFFAYKHLYHTSARKRAAKCALLYPLPFRLCGAEGGVAGAQASLWLRMPSSSGYLIWVLLSPSLLFSCSHALCGWLLSPCFQNTWMKRRSATRITLLQWSPPYSYPSMASAPLPS
jgi:hypothetical protein